MVNSSLLGAAVVAAATVSAMPGMDAEFEFSGLLKRQEPGTPAYNCHDNCGQIIIMNRQCGDNLCGFAGFQSNYANCLQCSGKDNVGIWDTFYGRSVSVAGQKCGLSTTPLAGVQPPVGPAVQAGTGNCAPASSTTTTPNTPPTTPPSPPTSTTGGGSGPAPTSTTTGGGSGGSPSSSAGSPSSSGSSRPSSSAGSSGAASSTSGAARPTTTGSGSTGGSSNNGTSGAGTTKPPVVVAGAAQNMAGVFGAVVALGAAYMAL